MIMGGTGNQMEFEGFDKRLPALMDGGTVLLPEATLPLPLGGRSPNPGCDGADDWADYAVTVLVPRWAVECIRDGLVLGQELAEDYDEDGYFPIETMQERVNAITRNQGEMDKWKRIVGWGIDVVRHLDLEQADKWNGSLVELLELGDVKSVPLGLRLAFSQKMGEFVAVYYWDSWAREGWAIVEGCFLRGGKLDDLDRKKAERLIAEGQTYWNRNPITGQPTVLSDRMFNGHWFLGERRWMNSDVNQMIKCLTELLAPKEKRELDMKTIWLLFRSHAGSLATSKAKEEDGVAYFVEREAICARAEARVAEAEARAATAEAEKFKAQGRTDAEAEARERAEEAQKRAEEKLRKEAEARAKAEALAEDRKRELDSLGPKIDEVKEVAEGAKAAAEVGSRLAAQTLAETQEATGAAKEAIEGLRELVDDKGEKWAQIFSGIIGHEKLKPHADLIDIIMRRWRGETMAEIAAAHGWKTHTPVSLAMQKAERLVPALRSFDWWPKKRKSGGGRPRGGGKTKLKHVVSPP